MHLGEIRILAQYFCVHSRSFRPTLLQTEQLAHDKSAFGALKIGLNCRAQFLGGLGVIRALHQLRGLGEMFKQVFIRRFPRTARVNGPCGFQRRQNSRIGSGFLHFGPKKIVNMKAHTSIPNFRHEILRQRGTRHQS